jgi:AraC family transcriptional regulator of adaptative response/methylated-DNA-[protein]-cysteine methyltransferase
MMDLLKENTASKTIALHVKGTEFQLKVWAALLEIPFGELSNYGEIAQQIGHSKASRAVGTAIGSNPIALLIPCHRVVQANGKLGGFKWGLERKAAIIAWEASYQD